jgi:hypothetical protein
MVLTTAPPFVYLVNFITASINSHRCSRLIGPGPTKEAVILDSSRAFPREHLEFKPLTTVQRMYYRAGTYVVGISDF